MAEIEHQKFGEMFQHRSYLQEMSSYIQSQRAAHGNAPASVLGITPFTGKSVTRNYSSFSHQDGGDYQ